MSDDKKVDVPAELPPLLKNYTKAAIRTQPEDLLKWTVEYFTCLDNGTPLPYKKPVV